MILELSNPSFQDALDTPGIIQFVDNIPHKKDRMNFMSDRNVNCTIPDYSGIDCCSDALAQVTGNTGGTISKVDVPDRQDIGRHVFMASVAR